MRARAWQALFVASLCGAGCANPYCGARGEPCCASAAGACAPTLSCHAGVCERCDTEFDFCCADHTCEGGLVCSRGLTRELCHVPCDVFGGGCPADRNCIWTPADAGLCVPIGVLGADARCTYVAECALGLMCSSHPGVSSYFCEPPCVDASGCDAMHQCIAIAAGDPRGTCF